MSVCVTMRGGGVADKPAVPSAAFTMDSKVLCSVKEVGETHLITVYETPFFRTGYRAFSSASQTAEQI